jgi:hypothetical protein
MVMVSGLADTEREGDGFLRVSEGGRNTNEVVRMIDDWKAGTGDQNEFTATTPDSRLGSCTWRLEICSACAPEYAGANKNRPTYVFEYAGNYNSPSVLCCSVLRMPFQQMEANFSYVSIHKLTDISTML